MANDLFSNLPLDLANEAGDADRKKQIALALLKQLMGGAPAPEKTRILGKQSWGSVLANAGAQGLAQNSLASADRDLGGIRKRGEEQYTQGVQGFAGASDPKKAIADLMSSNHPMLRTFAAAQEKSRLEHEKLAAERAQRGADEKGRTLREAVQAAKDAGDTAAALEMARTGVIPETYKAPERKAPVVGAAPGPDGKPMATVTNYDKLGIPKLDLKSGGVNVTNNPTIGATKAGHTKLIESSINQLEASAGKAQGAVALQNTLNELQSRSDKGIITGPAAVPLTWVTGLMKAANLPVDAEKLSRTETFTAFAQEAVQNLINQMPRGNAGITAAEADRISKIMPNATHSPEARAEITAILTAANARTVAAYRRQAKLVQSAVRDPDNADIEGIFLPEDLTASGLTPVAGNRAKAPAAKARVSGDPPPGSGIIPPAELLPTQADSSPENLRALNAEMAKHPVGSEQRRILEAELRRIQGAAGTAPKTSGGWKILGAK